MTRSHHGGRQGPHPEQAGDLYITDGSIDDWPWGVQGIRAYTFEMYPGPDGASGFRPPDEVIPARTSRNREAVPLLLEIADCVYRAIGKEAPYCSLPRSDGSGPPRSRARSRGARRGTRLPATVAATAYDQSRACPPLAVRVRTREAP